MIKAPMSREPTNKRSDGERDVGVFGEPTGRTPLEHALLAAGREDVLVPARREQLLRNISVAVGVPLALNAEGGGSDDVGPMGDAPGGLGSPTELGTQGLAIAAKTAGVEGLVLKVLGAVAVVGASVWGGLQVSSSRSVEEPASAPVSKAEVAPVIETPSAEPAAAEPAQIMPPAVGSAELAEVEEAASPKSIRGPKPRTGSDSLSRELNLIDGARAALLRGEPSSALRTLQTYRSQFPRGALQAEATVQRVEALIAIGDRGSASTIGESFLARHPESPYSQRIASLLGISRDPRVDAVRKSK